MNYQNDVDSCKYMAWSRATIKHIHAAVASKSMWPGDSMIITIESIDGHEFKIMLEMTNDGLEFHPETYGLLSLWFWKDELPQIAKPPKPQSTRKGKAIKTPEPTSEFNEL